MASNSPSRHAPRLEEDFPSAVRSGQVVPFYQPQISIETGRVVAAELLSRWQHPVFGMISPNVFIPIAESTRSIHRLGRQMLRACCRLGARWQSTPTPLDVAVNVTPSQLATDDFYDSVSEELDCSGIDPRRLTLEVTEATEIDDTATVAARLDRLRLLGVTVSIDDFGTGHSSSRRVVDLHATELKLDRGLVGIGAAERPIASAIEFAHGRGMRTVGEGVETRAQLARLSRFGCDRAQGFLIAEPAPEKQFDEWMHGAA